jgi:3',5'-cyclic AMP phosphodiesterase CpdA
MAVSPRKKEHSLVLHGLIPNTKFCYKIYVQNDSETGVQQPIEGTFKTLYSPERKIVNFLVVGNTSAAADGSNEEIKNRMAQSMANYEADFLIHTGDMVASGLVADADKEFFTPYQKILQNSPLLVALGEDEYGPDRATNEGKGFLTTQYRSIHSMPLSKGTPFYYYIDTANARFIFLDTNNVYDAIFAAKLSDKAPQLEWLKTSLSSTDAAKWKIVVLHHPVYSSGKEEDRLSKLLAPIFEANKVNLVIQGHQGAYERTAPIKNDMVARTGPTYITVAGGGKFFEPSSYNIDWSSKYYEIPHFAHVQIVDRKLSLRVYTHDNRRIDALDIHF